MSIPPEIQPIVDLLLKGLQGLVLIFAIALARHYIAKIRDERVRALVEALVRWAEQHFGPDEDQAKRKAVVAALEARRLKQPLSVEIEAAVNKLPPSH